MYILRRLESSMVYAAPDVSPNVQIRDGAGECINCRDGQQAFIPERKAWARMALARDRAGGA